MTFRLLRGRPGRALSLRNRKCRAAGKQHIAACTTSVALVLSWQRPSPAVTEYRACPPCKSEAKKVGLNNLQGLPAWIHMAV